jgi:hypothetical protein
MGMDVARLSRRTAVLLGLVGIVPQTGGVLADTRAERRRKRRRIALTCPQCPPAPNCTLTNGSTCTCTGQGEPCICDSCCPVCPSVCPQGEACSPDVCPPVCPDDKTCVDPKDLCDKDQVCANKDDVCQPEHVCCGGEGRVCTEKSKICEPPFKCVEEKES